MIRLLTVAAWLTMMGVVAIPSVGFGEANDPKERDALARALPQAQVPLARGLSASAREGVPLLAKFEIDDGVFASGADLVYMGKSVDTGGPAIIREMAEVGLVAPRVRVMGPGQLLADSTLKDATCGAALATEMRVTRSGLLPSGNLHGIGLKTYQDYAQRFGTAPTVSSFDAVDAGRVVIDGIRRAADALGRATTLIERRDAVRAAIAATRDFDGLIGRWSFDRNGDVDYASDELDATISGFKVVKADGPVGCEFEFDTPVGR